MASTTEGVDDPNRSQRWDPKADRSSNVWGMDPRPPGVYALGGEDVGDDKRVATGEPVQLG
jgi:hypothetical protein